MKKIIKLLKQPQYIFLVLGHRGFFNWLNDETYLKIAYWCKMGKKLNLSEPSTYNEKLQWLKLYNRVPDHKKLVDKIEVRKVIRNKIGEEYLIPLLGTWDKAEEINFDELPEQFVLKCTHDSGSFVICKDKSKLDKLKVIKKLNKSLKQDYYWGQREWIYKDLKPRIIAEQYMVDESHTELKDYKFFCFNGEVKAIYVASNRGRDTRFDFYDIDFNKLELKQKYPNAHKRIDKPKGLEEMLDLAKKLAVDLPHVRVDFYDINGKIYFGELTFFHFSGWEKFEPSSFDNEFGKLIDLNTIQTRM